MSERSALRGVLKHDEPLRLHTSWRVGGPARHFFEPADRADLISFVQSLPASEPLLWLGLGSNLLVRDGGFAGTVISLHGALSTLEFDGSTLSAGAGVHCARLAKFAQQQQQAGLGFMAGIPGTVGGALAMNAGAWGGETWPVVAQVEVLYRNGSSAWLPTSDFPHSYRQVQLPADFCGFLAAQFSVSPDADGSHAAYTKDALAKRKASQPVGKPSAGSTFRNPPGDYAARLIEGCGLKGQRIGGASVSEQHANFVLTEDGACAADVEALIHHIQTTVAQHTGVQLHPEVRVVGEQA